VVDESEIFSKIGGKSETEGKMHHGLRGDGRLWSQRRIRANTLTDVVSHRARNLKSYVASITQKNVYDYRVTSGTLN